MRFVTVCCPTVGGLRLPGGRQGNQNILTVDQQAIIRSQNGRTECEGAYIWSGQGRNEYEVPLHHPHYDFNDDVPSIGIRLHVSLVERHLAA